ncbi:MAG TPA: hypothetical protein VFD43_06420 [Planctomycetota bacterium]|nr:hypothetical protein [Planctomycetota bacterium]
MSPHPAPPRPALRARRPGEAGWVLAASLVLATMATAVTITYARHALLAKRTLQFGKGASEVDEASRSELERVRELMRIGDKPGTIATGDHDAAVTPTGEQVQGERQVTGHGQRELRVQAQGNSTNSDEEAKLKAHSTVVPGNQPEVDSTTLECPTGNILLAGTVTIVSGSQSYVGTELAGFFVLEDGSQLTLQDVILHGAVLTRHGACREHPAATGTDRPKLSVFGGLKLVSGTELPDVAIVAPDMILEADATSRVDIQGFVSADEVLVNGRGSMHGMVVHNALEQFGSKMRRPGHGRGPQDWPVTVSAGAEEVASLSFPVATVPDSVIQAMATAEIN